MAKKKTVKRNSPLHHFMKTSVLLLTNSPTKPRYWVKYRLHFIFSNSFRGNACVVEMNNFNYFILSFANSKCFL